MTGLGTCGNASRTGQSVSASRHRACESGTCPASGVPARRPVRSPWQPDLSSQDVEFQNFVIAHELLHLRVPNHGKLFKALMTAHVPDWREHDITK